VGTWVNQYDVFCGVVVNGVRLGQPHCRSAGECVEEILSDYKREVVRLREPPLPPPSDPAGGGGFCGSGLSYKHSALIG
jgi:hypothetical protein